MSLDIVSLLMGKTLAGGKPTLKPGVIRPDAELIKTYSDDKMVVTDLEITIPAYSTSSKTLISGDSIADKVSIDYAAYDWFVLCRALAYPIYSPVEKGAGLFDFFVSEYDYEIMEIPSGKFKSILDPAASFESRIVDLIGYGNVYRKAYWESDSSFVIAELSAGGLSASFSAPSLSNAKLTLKTPDLKIQGNSNLLSSAYWSSITDIRWQYVVEVYRAPKNDLNLDGWTHKTQVDLIAGCVNSQNHTLR